MAGICYVRSPLSPALTPPLRTNRMIFRCSSRHDRSDTPRLLKTAVNGVTALLRFFRSGNERSNREHSTFQNGSSAFSIDDILVILKSDYERAYFLTGNFTSAIYAEDCSFEDPTIKFRGKDLYSRNLELLVPFFECPSLALKNIEKGFNGETEFVVATWALRTYLKLPWSPLISIEGTTTYDLDNEVKIIRHVERWNVSALQAIGQIFTPGFRSMVND
ncbi:hypothetical protein AAC387_Pa02g1056 [Persea americana]